ncbi:hypothetical protein EKL29_08035 [Pantoea sp. YU22]|uniref:hypothetical protein n=1 Tax=Pantoea sp. YU22 TaxID=2497684 RepID=UPI000F889080|nr:hypothetical protein [Pantoea sp. YU22]RTY58772.1 hypothetical protein EKL29_08035 [Pantoea sp. YU22]
MQKFKGTSGKWSYQGPLGEIKSDTGGLIADLIVNGKEDENGQLMAAAPELLEALQCLKRELVLSDVDLAYIESHFRPHIDRASAAIKKALGQ